MTPLLYPASGHVHPYPTGEDLLDRSQPPSRVWVPDRSALVLGYSQEPDAELHAEIVAETKIPVYRRKGGGGAVLLSPGCVCIALRFKRRPGFGIPEYFGAANGFLGAVLREEFGVDLQPRGISDLAWEERKALGSSLYLPRECGLYLASLLVSAPLALWDRFLRLPSRQPDYRQGRGHAEFVRNLAEIPGLSFLTAPLLKNMLESRLEKPAPELELDG